jgi:hypothetical protein
MASSCEESLPPHIHPLSVDPSTVLAIAFEANSGTVFFQEPDTASSSLAGTFYLTVTNLHDEFLSGREQIDALVEIWKEGQPGNTFVARGDRDNLINRYDPQGETFLLEGDILSLAPDHSAVVVLGMDHLNYGLFNDASPRYEIEQCPTYPACTQRVITEDIPLHARASIRLFEQQSSYLSVEDIPFVISYYFDINGTGVAIVDSLSSSFDMNTGSVNLDWVTFLEFGICGFSVEKARIPGGGYTHIDTLASQGSGIDTIAYAYADTHPLTGTWSYRLGVRALVPYILRPVIITWADFPAVEVP